MYETSLQKAMTSSGEQTSAESEGSSRLLHQEATNRLLRPPISILEQILRGFQLHWPRMGGVGVTFAFSVQGSSCLQRLWEIIVNIPLLARGCTWLHTRVQYSVASSESIQVLSSQHILL